MIFEILVNGFSELFRVARNRHRFSELGLSDWAQRPNRSFLNHYPYMWNGHEKQENVSFLHQKLPFLGALPEHWMSRRLKQILIPVFQILNTAALDSLVCPSPRWMVQQLAFG